MIQVDVFPESPLAGLPGEIVSVVEHFFFHDGLPRLLLVVRKSTTRRRIARLGPAGRTAPKDDPRLGLTADEAELYDRLRDWRRGRSEADGVPVYVIFNNRELAEVARRRPSSLTALREVPGIGQNKAQRYGPDLLRMLAAEDRTKRPAVGREGAMPGLRSRPCSATGSFLGWLLDRRGFPEAPALHAHRADQQPVPGYLHADRRGPLPARSHRPSGTYQPGPGAVRLLMRLARDRRVLDPRSFFHACESIDTAGRMVGAWLKKQQEEQMDLQ